MKIGIDVSMVDHRKAGIGYYAFELAKKLAVNDINNDYYLFTHNIEVTRTLFPKGFKIIEIRKNKPNTFWIFKVVNYLKKNNFDIFVSPSNFMFGILFKNTIQVVHDISPVTYPDFFSWKARFMFKNQLKLLVKKVKVVTTISQTSKNDIIKHFGYGEKIHITGCGLNDWVYDAPNSKTRELIKQKYKLPEKYIFSLSTIEPRKNHINMIKAFKIFLKDNPDFGYVIGGKKGWFYEDIFKTVKDLNLERKVKFIGYVPDNDIATLFDMAQAFIYVSYWEGLGLPPVEAYTRGTPSVVSNTEIFKETMEDKALFAKPDNIEEIAKKIRVAVKMKRNFVRKEEFINRYNWNNIAKNIINIYKFIKNPG